MISIAWTSNIVFTISSPPLSSRENLSHPLEDIDTSTPSLPTQVQISARVATEVGKGDPEKMSEKVSEIILSIHLLRDQLYYKTTPKEGS